MYNSYNVKRYSMTLLIPGFLIYLALFILPLLMSLFYSFTNWDFFTAKFIGLSNYISIFSNPDISIGIKNTLIFAFITTFLKVLFGTLLALFLNRELKTANFMRTVYYLPSVINMVAVGVAFSAILHPSVGILNKAFGVLGAGFLQQDWLTNPSIALYSVSLIEVWKWSGFTMVIILAGLQSVQKEYYEASTVDGANSWIKFWKITFPLIMPSINNAIVANLIGGLKVFDIILVMTGGGPGRATTVLNLAVYEAFGSGRQGEANAGIMIVNLFVAAIAIPMYAIIRRKEVEIH